MKISKRVIIASNDKKDDKKIIRKVAYCRVSTIYDNQYESYNSQLEYYQNLIDHEDNSILVRIYGDFGISGLLAKDRKEFITMIDDASKGLFDFIYVKSISRFARNVAECIKYLEILSSYGVSVYFEKESICSDDKRLHVILKILATIAQEESNSISLAIKWSYKRNALIGNPTRVCPYGYTKIINKDNHKHIWMINKEEAKRIRFIFASALKYKSIKEIVDAINIKEKNCHSKVVFNAPKIRSILQNEAYIGNIITNKYIVIDYITKKVIKNKEIEDKIKITNHHLPIISNQLFYMVNRKYGFVK